VSNLDDDQTETLDYILRFYADASIPVVDAMVTSTSSLESAYIVKVDREMAAAMIGQLAKGTTPEVSAAFLRRCARVQAQQMATSMVHSSDGFASFRHAALLNAHARYGDVLCTGLARTLRNIADGEPL
jgi:hypothetical protein